MRVSLQVVIVSLISLHEILAFAPRHMSIRQPKSLQMAEDLKESMESLRSIIDFHEATWKGKASSFTITNDIASGVVKRQESPEYRTTVKIGLDLRGSAYSLKETLEFDDKVATRELSLVESNCDVDSVDGSYSLDNIEPDFFPTELLGTEQILKFSIEHCIAINNNERIRCFINYGIDGSLARVVVCEEEKLGASRQEEDDDENQQSNGTPVSSGSSNVIDTIIGGTSANGDSRAKSQRESKTPTEGGRALRRCPMNLVQMGSGLWLGDMVIREPSSYVPNKGFGSGPVQRQGKKYFGRWSTGVQKLVHQWKFDLDDSVSKVVNVGNAIGTAMALELCNSLSGLVCTDETFSVQIPPDKKYMFIDWNGGEFAGFIKGHVGMLVPRFLFDMNGSTSRRPFFTELCVYQTNAPEKDSQFAFVLDEDDETSEMCCSTNMRVYDSSGQLKQGASGFFTQKSFASINKESSSSSP